MNISEQDIFNFVFNPVKLKNEVRTYIEKHFNDFEDEINLCKNIHASLENSIPQDIIAKIEERISNAIKNSVVELYKLPVPARAENRHLTLAAESNIDSDTSDVSVDTYVDKESNYMIKVINTPEAKKLILFEKGNTFVEDFTIKIYPSTITFEHISNEEPVLLNKNENIEKIVLTIH